MHQMLAARQRNRRIVIIVAQLFHTHRTGLGMGPLRGIHNSHEPRYHITGRVHSDNGAGNVLLGRRGRENVITAHRTVQQIGNGSEVVAFAPGAILALLAEVGGHRVHAGSPARVDA